MNFVKKSCIRCVLLLCFLRTHECNISVSQKQRVTIKSTLFCTNDPIKMHTNERQAQTQAGDGEFLGKCNMFHMEVGFKTFCCYKQTFLHPNTHCSE